MVLSRGKQVVPLWRAIGVLSMSSACLVVSGCGNGLAQVSGQVTLDGQPLHGGQGDTRVTVQFQPANGVGPNAVGLADENGNYTMALGSEVGLPPGDYVVTCSISEIVAANAPPGSRHIADPKYGNAKTSGLRLTVQPGKNQFDIPLKSPSKSAPRRGA